MCGILAILGKEYNINSFSNSLKILRHRGPDYTGIIASNKFVLGHERLCIVGLNTGNQPFNINNIQLIANGEIYNHIELKEQIINEGYLGKFYGDSDCEIILHLYKHYGEHFQEKCTLCGMYAYVLCDKLNNIFVVGRDIYGIIPLYIGWTENNIYFASELKALKDCKNIDIFKPNNYSVGDINTLMFKNYNHCKSKWIYDIEFIPKGEYIPNVLKSKFINSVKRHMMCDVNYAVLLSGGLDSSLVASIVTKEIQKTGKRLKTFSIGLADSSDLKAAKIVSEFLDTDHTSIEYTLEEGLMYLKDVIYTLETFDVTTIRASIPMYIMGRKIKSLGIKMVLSGEGADEIFGGYLYFHKAPNKEEFHKELVRKVKKLHLYDNLRANKSLMAWGIETRVPFQDTEFMEYVMNIDPKYKMCSGDKIQKHILREAFVGDFVGDYLPDEVLWRQKEQFSDGVGYSWIDGLKELSNNKVTDLMLSLADKSYPVSTPLTKEAYLYRQIFSDIFTKSEVNTVPFEKSIACSTGDVMHWDESFIHNSDPSGLSVKDIHNLIIPK